MDSEFADDILEETYFYSQLSAKQNLITLNDFKTENLANFRFIFSTRLSENIFPRNVYTNNTAIIMLIRPGNPRDK